MFGGCITRVIPQARNFCRNKWRRCFFTFLSGQGAPPLSLILAIRQRPFSIPRSVENSSLSLSLSLSFRSIEISISSNDLNRQRQTKTHNRSLDEFSETREMPPATCIFRSLPLSILRILSLKSHVVSRNCLEYYSLLLLLSIQSRVFRRNVQSSVILTIFTRKIRAQNERSPNGKNSSHRFLLALRPNARTNFLELFRNRIPNSNRRCVTRFS